MGVETPRQKLLLRRELQNKDSLLVICESLHMDHTGASDPLLPTDKEKYIKILKLALDSWQESALSELYDNCVRLLIMATLEEINELRCQQNF